MAVQNTAWWHWCIADDYYQPRCMAGKIIDHDGTPQSTHTCLLPSHQGWTAEILVCDGFNIQSIQTTHKVWIWERVHSGMQKTGSQQRLKLTGQWLENFRPTNLKVFPHTTWKLFRTWLENFWPTNLMCSGHQNVIPDQFWFFLQMERHRQATIFQKYRTTQT